MMVSNRPADAAEIESRISDGNGLLANGGASIDNMFSGDATHVRMVMSKLNSDQDKAGRDRSMYYFLLNPYSIGRTIVRTLGELVKELYQAWQQRRRGIEPRMHRGVKFAGLRATTNVVLRDLNHALVAEQMLRGTPVMYVDFVDYDDIAHHTGPERQEALQSLAGIDRAIGRLERMVPDCPRPYRFVIVSDHGQSQGATFRQRYGETIEEWLRKRIGADVTRTATAPVEEAGRLSTALTEASSAEGATAALGTARPPGQHGRRRGRAGRPGRRSGRGADRQAARPRRLRVRQPGPGVLRRRRAPHVAPEIEAAFPA